MDNFNSSRSKKISKKYYCEQKRSYIKISGQLKEKLLEQTLIENKKIIDVFQFNNKFINLKRLQKNSKSIIRQLRLLYIFIRNNNPKKKNNHKILKDAYFKQLKISFLIQLKSYQVMEDNWFNKSIPIEINFIIILIIK